jgi:hypothetical protein
MGDPQEERTYCNAMAVELNYGGKKISRTLHPGLDLAIAKPRDELSDDRLGVASPRRACDLASRLGTFRHGGCCLGQHCRSSQLAN